VQGVCTSFGYKLIERAAAFEFDAMNPGTLHRTLRHMEKDGLCQSESETNKDRGSARRVYTITDAGEAYLKFWAEALEQYRHNLDLFFSMHTGASRARTDQQEGEG